MSTTKPAPKLRLRREIEPARLRGSLDLRLRHAVVLGQMVGVCFFAIEDALAGVGAIGGVGEGAEPAGEVEVLGGLVAFPVGFAAEGFGAVRECAAVGAFVAFLVFSREGGQMDQRKMRDECKGRTYFISQRRRVRFEHTSHWNQSCFSSLGSSGVEDVSSDRRCRAAERIFWSI